MARAVRRRTAGGGGPGGGYGGTGGFGMGFGGGGLRFSLTPWVKRLLIANTAVFLAMILGLLPREFAWTVLGFAPDAVFRHPWSPVTYMFVHGGFWHLFFNMVGVFFFGPPLERKWGERFFIKFYLVAGLGGALFSVLMLPLIGPQLVVGASGALYGLLLAFAMNWPEAPIYVWGILPIRAKWFVAIFGFLALWGTVFAGAGGVAHWAHLGGLATGFVYLKYGERIGRRVTGLFVKPGGGSRASVTRISERPERTARPEARGPRRPRREVDGDTLDEVDRILDKIRERGIDSLTEEERRFLDEVSRRYQKTP